MIRWYDPSRPVPTEVIDTALRNAIRAPSAGFSQGWDFLVLTKPEDRQSYWGATSDADDEPDAWFEGMQTAPALILCLSDEGTYLRRYAEPDKGWTDMDEARWPVPYWDIDTGMAALLILQTAVDEGLGACFFGIPPGRIDEFRAEFAVPEQFTPIGAITVGHPALASAAGGSAATRTRKSVEEVVHRGDWVTAAPRREESRLRRP